MSSDPAKRLTKGVGVALLCGVLGLLAATIDASGPAPERQLWWHEPSIRRQLALTELQIIRLDAIFSRDLPARRAVHRRILQLDARVGRAIHEEDEVVLRRVSAELEDQRRQQNIRRCLMLVEMYRTLTSVQRARLSTLASTGPSRP